MGRKKEERWRTRGRKEEKEEERGGGARRRGMRKEGKETQHNHLYSKELVVGIRALIGTVCM